MAVVAETQQNATGSGWSAWRVIPLVVLGAGLVVFFTLGFDSYLSFGTLRDNREAILAWSRENYWLSVALFIAVYYLAVTFSLPGAVWMTIAAGFLFGTLPATLYVVIGATLGSAALFLAARYAFGGFLRAKADGGVRRMERGFREHAFSYLLVLRLVPLFPFWLVNLVPAFLGVPFRTFVLGTFIGIVPGTFVFSSVGSGLGGVLDRGESPDLGIVFEPAVIGPMIGLAVLALIPVFYKKFKAR